MNALTAHWLRLELRRRLRSLTALGLLIALASGTVLAGVAAARRGDSAIERLTARTLPADVIALPNQPGFDWAPIRALPEVEALSGIAIAPFFVEGLPEFFGYLPPADTEAMRTIERPVVLDGRVPDPARANEVAATPLFLTTYGKRLGDTLTLRLMTPQQAEDLSTWSGAGGGPLVPARIVGVVRSPFFSDSITTPGNLFPSPALVQRYTDNFLGARRDFGFVNALVRLRGGEQAIPAFSKSLAEATGRTNIELMNLHDKTRHLQRMQGFERDSLLAFALAALIAAMVLVGQSVARYTTASVGELQALRASGLTGRQSLAAAVAAPVLVSVAGAALGVALALAASWWTPIGAASLVEPDPGLDADWPVLIAGLVAVPVLVLAGALLAGRLALTTPGAPRRSAVATAAARAGLPVPVVVGARFALEPGRGRTSVPVRPALFSAVAGVLGVLAAFTFSAGVTDAVSNPARFGMTYQLMLFMGEGGRVFGPTEQAARLAAADPGVAGVTLAYSDVGNADDTSVALFSFEPDGTPVDAVLTEGRMPAGAGEVALGVSSARALGAEVGDVVTLSGHELRVTGVGFVMPAAHNEYHEGGWLTGDGFRAMFGDGFKYFGAMLALRPGADPAAVHERLAAALRSLPGENTMSVDFVQPPEAATEISNLRVLPILLAVFLAVLAVGAVGHALATAVRRRAVEVAVMRALGMTRRQARTVVIMQATLLAVIGLSFGVPLGVALGRTLWRVVADQTPLFYQPPIAFWALLLVTPVAVLVANALAVWPGRRAARMRIGHVLRAE
ncbi:ABC transporter permease [Nonomuraea soli]|uniref:ABC-type lipoprotein release transport system permease subunit n=1 Tax=Nonomuraea soli TaxID=1032476 RepID=A0A7W0CEP5_9ACTN|nr:FtsX-like permease family protein [Nonomuraea soli]MBA2889788.1 ABC-type lipoprotein release transport system permease subunit [Nonomuraea soli]